MSVEAAFRVDAQLQGTWRDVITAAAPVGWWRLGEQVGTTVAADASGNARTGTYTGGVTLEQTGMGADADRAVLLNGTTGYVDLGTTSTFGFTASSFSVELWFKTSSAANPQMLISRAASDGSYGWSFFLGAGIINFLGTAAGVTQWLASTAGTYHDGAWHHVIATYDRVNALATIYEAGAKVAQSASIGDASVIVRRTMIGGRDDGAGGIVYPFSGTIDEVALYDNVLAGPVGRWRLGETAGAATAVDASGFARNGTYTGGVTLGKTGVGYDTDTAALFNGTTGYVDMGTTTAFAFAGSFSIDAWFKSTSAGLVMIVARGDLTGSEGWNLHLAAGQLLFSGVSAGVVKWTVVASGTYNDGVWHHVIATYDSSAASAKLYVAGVLVGQFDSTGNASTPVTRFMIGGRDNGAGGVNSPFDGTIDDVAVYDVALTVPNVDDVVAHYNATIWTSLAADVSAVDAFTWRRGMAGGGPLDRIATTGTCEFGLNNDSDNSGSTRGWYSPNHASVRAGWTFGIPVRVVATYSAVDYTLWTGKLRSVDPIPGVHRIRRVSCMAHDCFGDIAENGTREITPQLTQTENALIAAILVAMPVPARPTWVDYDGSLDTYPYALDNATSTIKALSLLTDVVMSALAYAYPYADGTLHIESRQTRGPLASSYTFTDATLLNVEVPSDLSGIYNRARVTIHPRRIDAAATTVLYGIDVALAVQAGGSITVWGDYVDPANPTTPIGGTAQVTPIVSGTDYSGNANEDGSGANLTANISVTTTAFAGAVKFVVSNSAGSIAYLVTAAGAPLLQIRGKGIYNESPIVSESYTAKTYGDRLLESDLPYQDDGEIAQSRATFYVAQYSNLADQILALEFDPQRTASLMTQALTGEMGQIVTTTETMTGITAVDAAIQAIEMDVRAGPFLSVRYLLAPRGPSATFILDDIIYGVLDSAEAQLAYA